MTAMRTRYDVYKHAKKCFDDNCASDRMDAKHVDFIQWQGAFLADLRKELKEDVKVLVKTYANAVIDRELSVIKETFALIDCILGVL